MAFLEENCVLSILTDGILSECHPFVCGDDDMDEFNSQVKGLVLRFLTLSECGSSMNPIRLGVDLP